MQSEVKKLALVFPGQGAQYERMGNDLATDFPVAAATRNAIAAVFRDADEGFDLVQLMESGHAKDLLRTDVCQAVVFAHSAMAWAAFDEELRRADAAYCPVAALGHSFGELTAHLVAGTLDVNAMSALVFHRGHLMLGSPEGALLNVEECDREEVLRLIAAYSASKLSNGNVYLAISQAPRLHTVGGLSAGIDEFGRYLRKQKVNCRLVTGVHKPLHTPLQQSIRLRFEDVLARMPFEKPRFPVISTGRGDFHVPGEAAQELAAQIDSEMRFSQSIRRIGSLNPDLYVVFGPGSKLAELLAYYNGIDPDRIRVVERSAQVGALVAECCRSASDPKRLSQNRQTRSLSRLLLKRTLLGFEEGHEQYVLLEPDGTIDLLKNALGRSGTLIYYKGSFNPIHVGHVALFEASRRRHPGSWGFFALSVHTNKGLLDTAEMLFRARLILRAGYAVALSYSGYFYENVAWIHAQAPGLRLVMPTGVDALRRLIHYFSPEAFADHFSGVIFEYADREGQKKLLPEVGGNPSYSGIRCVQLVPEVRTLTSSAIREAARKGMEQDLSSQMPGDTLQLFLKRWRGRS
jgi:[acyl-carrier-protein] S-malonyltransferase